MNFEQWWDEYKPTKNIINPHASGPNITEGDDNTPHVYNLMHVDIEHVIQAAQSAPGTVWTLLEVDGSQFIVSGLHRVNREGFYITEKAYTGQFLEVSVFDDDDEDDFEHDEFDGEREAVDEDSMTEAPLPTAAKVSLR